MQGITGETKLLGVIGYPVEHSLSPAMHNAAIARIASPGSNPYPALDYVYLPFPVKPQDLETAVAGFGAIAVAGFNITIPHKQAIIPLLDEVSPVARAVGAVNTVWRTDRGWAGTNTDVEGFLAPLKNSLQNDSKQQWQETIAVILGAGGAARAAVVGCAQLGCREIHVVGRNPEKLEAFARSWENRSWDNGPLEIRPIASSWEALPELIPQAGAIVNATPVGMYPNVERSPLSPTLTEQIKADTIVYDLIYTPNPTLFLRQAREAGVRTTIDGLEMLVQQGAAALKIWLNRPVPVDVMRQTLQKSLGISP